MEEKPKVKRRIVVDAQLQYGLVRWSLTVFYAACLVFYLMINFVFVNFKFILQNNSIEATENVKQGMAELQNQANGFLGILLVAFTIIVVIGGLHLSKKIAGPIQSIKMNLDNLIQGREVINVKFRRSDYFFELQDKFNQYLEHMRAKHKR